MLVRVKKAKQERFEECAAGLWKWLVRSGKMDVEQLPSKQDQVDASGYSAKELWRDEAIEQFGISTEFAPTERNN